MPPNPAAPDPIKPVVDALKNLALPQGTPGNASSFKNNTAKEQNPALAKSIEVLMQALYKASADMNGVGTAIVTALKDVAGVITALGDAVANLTSLSDVANAMGQLQQAMVLAQTLAPAASVAVLDPAGNLFTQIQGLLSNAASPANAAIELYSLAQQLMYVAKVLDPATSV